MLVAMGCIISACYVSTSLTIKLVKRIKDAQKREEALNIQNDWRYARNDQQYSRRPKDLWAVPKLYNLWTAISIFRELRYNGTTETRAYKYLIKSGDILVTDKEQSLVYMFDNLKWKVYSSNNLVAVASIHEPDGDENWIPVGRDKDIQERVEQMLNRLIILLRKTEQDLKNEDDRKFSDQKASILGNGTRKHDMSPMAALEAPSVIKNVMSLTEKDALGIRL
jgi:hypothetical protein